MVPVVRVESGRRSKNSSNGSQRNSSFPNAMLGRSGSAGRRLGSNLRPDMPHHMSDESMRPSAGVVRRCLPRLRGRPLFVLAARQAHRSISTGFVPGADACGKAWTSSQVSWPDRLRSGRPPPRPAPGCPRASPIEDQSVFDRSAFAAARRERHCSLRRRPIARCEWPERISTERLFGDTGDIKKRKPPGRNGRGAELQGAGLPEEAYGQAPQPPRRMERSEASPGSTSAESWAGPPTRTPTPRRFCPTTTLLCPTPRASPRSPPGSRT